MSQVIKQFLRFLIVGAVNTGVDFGIYLLLTRYLGVPYVLSTVISVGCAMGVSYLLHKAITFRNREPHSVNKVAKFLCVGLTGMAINAGIVYCGVHIFGIYDLYAKIGATLAVLIWSFLLQKIWVFEA